MTIDAARKRVKAATPGPWDWGWADDITKPPTAFFERSLDAYTVRPNIGCLSRTKQGYNDALFIARARTEYPLALDVVEAAQEHARAVGEWMQRDEPEPPLRTLKAFGRLREAIAAFEAATDG